LSAKAPRERLIRPRRAPASARSGGATQHGPRRYRAAPVESAPADGWASALAQLVESYVAHLEAGACSARGKPYSRETVIAYRDALRVFVRTAGRHC